MKEEGIAAEPGNSTEAALHSPQLVIIAASAGGLEPVRQILRELPADFPAAIALILHRGSPFPERLIDLLKRWTALDVRHAETGIPLRPATVYVCPPGVHMVSDRCIRLVDGPRVRFVRPSADLMFESAADVHGSEAIAVILSGAGSDGATGSLAMAQAGSTVLVQSPETCQFAGMPAAALKIGASRIPLAPGQIAGALCKLVRTPPHLTVPASRSGDEHVRKTTVFLADDHEIVLEGLHVLIDGEADMRVVGKAEDGTAALQRSTQIRPDVIVMDICMPGLDGVDATHQIVSRAPAVKVVALSSRSDAHMVNRMLEAGASGYLTKSRAFDELARAIRAVKSDHLYFSSDVAKLVDSTRLRAWPAGRV
jgi:chemotaxis response regulator CheB